MMNHQDFLNAIIDDGIHEIEANYTRPDQRDKREGGIAGFNACRGKTDQELLDLHTNAQRRSAFTFNDEQDRYWYHRYYELQIEWVLNVLSAARYNQGVTPLIPPTIRGLTKAADILGIATV